VPHHQYDRKDLALAELAAQSRFSPYHVCREFKRAMGSSPHQYVLDRRIARAREQLELGGDSLAGIAYAFGFSSHAAHDLDIQKRIGATPGRYRNDRRS
jgi:AraC family transcriptional regulator